MSDIIKAGDAVTMTSLELVDFINDERKREAIAVGESFPSKGFAVLAHGDFLKKVPEVLGAVAGNFSCYYTASNGKQNPAFRFPKREACLMAMSYSYDLQAKVFDRMTALEGGRAIVVPQSLPEALRLAADLAEGKAKAEQERDVAVATKAQIGNKREATAMATASKAVREVAKLRDELGFNGRHATVTAVEGAIGSKFPKNVYVGLRKWCKLRGVAPVKVVDPRYGHVKAWPAGAWKDVYNIDLIKLFDDFAGAVSAGVIAATRGSAVRGA